MFFIFVHSHIFGPGLIHSRSAILEDLFVDIILPPLSLVHSISLSLSLLNPGLHCVMLQGSMLISSVHHNSTQYTTFLRVCAQWVYVFRALWCLFLFENCAFVCVCVCACSSLFSMPNNNLCKTKEGKHISSPRIFKQFTSVPTEQHSGRSAGIESA